MLDERLDAIEEAIRLTEVVEPCPYLNDRVMTLRFCHGLLAGHYYGGLLDRGYRRTGNLLYQPVCRDCQECHVLRVPVDTFRRSKEQRRIWNRGQADFTHVIAKPGYTPEKAGIYRRYLEAQHEPDEAAASEEHFSRFLVETCLGPATFELQLRRAGELVAFGIVDRVENALSSVYFCFDPSVARWSPGTYASLVEIDLAHQWGLAYYYLGYYIPGCRAMNYKTRFRPCEYHKIAEENWVRLAR